MRGSNLTQPCPSEGKVLCAAALQPAMVELLDLFKAETGTEMAIGCDFNPAIARRIENGETFDVTVINPHLIDRLIGLGLVDPDSKRAFGQSPLGLGARQEHRQVDVSTVAGFARALGEAKSIGYGAEGTSGGRLFAILDRMQVMEAVRGKLVPMPAGHAGFAVATGEIEFCLAPISTILAAAPETVVAGTLPAEFDIQIEFAAAVSLKARNRSVASAFAAFLTTPRIETLIKAKGIERPAT